MQVVAAGGQADRLDSGPRGVGDRRLKRGRSSGRDLDQVKRQVARSGIEVDLEGEVVWSKQFERVPVVVADHVNAESPAVNPGNHPQVTRCLPGVVAFERVASEQDPGFEVLERGSEAGLGQVSRASPPPPRSQTPD